jgi:hypothetical protein
MDHPVTTKSIIAESIREANFGANEHAAVELDKVPLIRPAYYVVIEKDRFRSAAAEGERAAEIPGICAACKSKYRLLEAGLGGQCKRIGKEIVWIVASYCRIGGSCIAGFP